MPLLFIVTLGVSAVRRKSQFHAVTSAVLVGLWIAAAAVMAVAASDLPSCRGSRRSGVAPSSVEPASKSPVAGSVACRCRGVCGSRFQPGEAYGVSVSGDGRLLSDIEANVVDGSCGSVGSRGHPCFLCVDRPMEVAVACLVLDAGAGRGFGSRFPGRPAPSTCASPMQRTSPCPLVGQSATATVMDGGSLQLDGNGEFPFLSVSGGPRRRRSA